MSSPTTRTGALFVDFENVFFALLNGNYQLSRDAALSATLEAISGVRDHLRNGSTALVVERSYADWEQIPATAQRQLQIAGVLPRFTDSRRDKNTADIELSLDVLQQVLVRDDLHHVAIIGGDRDYLPVLRRLKEQHRQITVCSLIDCLSGDVREFLGNYPQAAIVELDALIEVEARRPQEVVRSSAPPTSNTPAVETAPPTKAPPVPSEVEPHDWHERYVEAMLRFIKERRVKEVHLGPFFRWLQTDGAFDLVSVKEQRRTFDEVVEMGAVEIEERDTGQGYHFSVAHLNWNNDLVRQASTG